MEFTLDFISMFSIGLFYVAPVLATLALIIVILGHVIGRLEGWSKLNALYYAFITATTVGYGDFCPRRRRSKFLTIVITFVGIIFTGIVVAVALHAVTRALEKTHTDTNVIEQVIEQP